MRDVIVSAHLPNAQYPKLFSVFRFALFHCCTTTYNDDPLSEFYLLLCAAFRFTIRLINIPKEKVMTVFLFFTRCSQLSERLANHIPPTS